MDLPIRIPLETTPNETSEVNEDGSDLLNNRSRADPAKNATSQLQPSAPNGNLYQPLPAGESIRLLQLQPGPRDEPISCNLQPANFNDNLPAYEALSYVWGSSSDTRPIICNGREVAVTRNLRNALRRLRRHDSTRLIWVDAICINQRNDEERGHQVRHMGSIYQRATRVLIWLGKDESEEAEQAFLLVCSIANCANDDSEDNPEDDLNEAPDERSKRNPTTNSSNSSTAKSDFRSNKKLEGSPQEDLETNPAASHEGNVDNNSVENSGKNIATFVKDSIKEPLSNTDKPPPWDSSLWGPVKSLLDKSWFTRMWVVQEVILAKSATVIWGDAEIDWNWIGTAAREIWDNYQILGQFRTRGLENAYFMHSLFQEQHKAEPEFYNFLELLYWFQNLEVSDARDKVFALVGIPTQNSALEDGSIFVEPNYTLNVRDVYIRLARKIMEQDEILSILACVMPDGSSYPERVQDFGLPSWVPNWTVYWAAVPIMGFYNSTKHTASGPVRLEIIENDDSKVLLARGLELDLVSQVLPVLEDGDYGSVPERIRLCIDAYLNHGSSLQQLSKTFTAGYTGSNILIEDDISHLADFAAFLRRLDPAWTYTVNDILESDLSGHKGDAEHYQAALYNYCTCRRLFFTSHGKLGLGPAAMAEGDTICILFGGQTPFVLRHEINHYILIGACYIADIMKGEAITEWQSGSATIVEKVFELR